MIAATSAQANPLAGASITLAASSGNASPTLAPPANDVALAAGATPAPAVAGKPASSFDAMLAALAPQQGAEAAVQPTSARLALGDGAGEDGATPATTSGDEDLAGDVAGDAPLLTALAAGLTLPAIQAQLAARTAVAGRSQATPATTPAKGIAQPAAADPGATAAAAQPAAATPSATIPDAAPAPAPAPANVTPGFDIEAMFPGLTARLDGVAGAKGARGKPASPAAAVTGSTPATADATATPAAAPGIVAAPAKAEAKHPTAPALDALTATPAPPALAPVAASAHSPDASGTPVASAAPAADGVQTQLTVAQDGAWLDRLARDIAQSADRNAKLSFQLNPEHLGTLKVELANGADGTQVRFTADTEAARSLLADQQPRLLAEARAQGMRIADSAVALANQSAQASAGQSFQQQGQSGQRVAWTPLPVTSGSTTQTLAETAAIAPPSGERYA